MSIETSRLEIAALILAAINGGRNVHVNCVQDVADQALKQADVLIQRDKVVEKDAWTGIGWIPVTQMLPDPLTTVLVFTSDLREWIGELFPTGVWSTRSLDSFVEDADVTHWMPFPDPPKTK